MNAPLSEPPRAAGRPSAGARAQRILHEPRLLATLLAGAVMAAVATWVIAFSGAFFTTTTSTPNNAFSAAEVQLTQSTSGQIFDGSNLTPGSTRTGTISVTNTKYPTLVTLSVKDIASVPSSPSLTDVISITVTETSPSNVLRYSGALSGLTDVQLGNFASGEKRDYRIQLDWPATSDSLTRANAQTTFTFAWNATTL